MWGWGRCGAQAAPWEEVSRLSSEGRGVGGCPAPDPGCRLLSTRPRAPGTGRGGWPCTRRGVLTVPCRARGPDHQGHTWRCPGSWSFAFPSSKKPSHLGSTAMGQRGSLRPWAVCASGREEGQWHGGRQGSWAMGCPGGCGALALSGLSWPSPRGLGGPHVLARVPGWVCSGFLVGPSPWCGQHDIPACSRAPSQGPLCVTLACAHKSACSYTSPPPAEYVLPSPCFGISPGVPAPGVADIHPRHRSLPSSLPPSLPPH